MQAIDAVKSCIRVVERSVVDHSDRTVVADVVLAKFVLLIQNILYESIAVREVISNEY
jgi:hypothetical protein